MRLSVGQYRGSLKIEGKILKQEEDYIKVDDSWLKMSKIMINQLRREFLKARMASYAQKEVDKYLPICMEQMSWKKGIINRAGEMICAYLELDEDMFMHFREGAGPTILEQLDPVQFLIPTPETSKVIPDLERGKTIKILNEILNAGSRTIKEYQSQLGLNRDQLQPLYHILVEDILWTEFRFDFEDFKQTIMSHRILEDPSIVQQIFEIEQDLSEHFEDDFADLD